MSAEAVIEQIKALTPVERAEVMRFLQEAANPVEGAVPWDRFVDAMYGIQGNDPIERAPQPVLETRDELR